MSLEETIANNNADIFLQEFTFSSTRFDRSDGQEVELCDGAIWLDDLLLLFQLKERNPDHDTSNPVQEQKWFERKVEKVAVGQFADTIHYLKKEDQLPFRNRRGQELNLSRAKPTRIHLLAIFNPSDALPIDVTSRKGRVSQRVGFVHYLHLKDYQAICLTLHTPFEIAEYLDFRKHFVERNPKVHGFSEKALVGKFLTDTDDSHDISDQHELVVDRLLDDRNEFNISQLLRVYLDRIVDGNEDTQYHAILTELAKLQRNMLREFRKRFEWALSVCHEESQPKPSRFFPIAQQCAFIAIPLPTSERGNWQRHLKVYTYLCKYDCRAKRCIGFTTAVDENHPNAFCIHWLFLDFDWVHDPELDQAIEEGSWFRGSKQQAIGKYKLQQHNSINPSCFPRYRVLSPQR